MLSSSCCAFFLSRCARCTFCIHTAAYFVCAASDPACCLYTTQSHWFCTCGFAAGWGWGQLRLRALGLVAQLCVRCLCCNPALDRQLQSVQHLSAQVRGGVLPPSKGTATLLEVFLPASTRSHTLPSAPARRSLRGGTSWVGAAPVVAVAAGTGGGAADQGIGGAIGAAAGTGTTAGGMSAGGAARTRLHTLHPASLVLCFAAAWVL